MSGEISYEDLPDGVVRVTLEIDAQLLLEVHEDVARILVRDLLRNALVRRQQAMRQGRFDLADAYFLRAQEQQTRENRARYYEELRRLMAESSAFTEELRGAWSYGFPSSTPARGCDSHIFTDPACTVCTANAERQARRIANNQTKPPRKLNPKHPLNAIDGERE